MENFTELASQTFENCDGGAGAGQSASNGVESVNFPVSNTAGVAVQVEPNRLNETYFILHKPLMAMHLRMNEDTGWCAQGPFTLGLTARAQRGQAASVH